MVKAELCTLPGCSPRWVCEAPVGSCLSFQSPALILWPITKKNSVISDGYFLTLGNAVPVQCFNIHEKHGEERAHMEYTYMLCESFWREQLPTHFVPVEKNKANQDSKSLDILLY